MLLRRLRMLAAMVPITTGRPKPSVPPMLPQTPTRTRRDDGALIYTFVRSTKLREASYDLASQTLVVAFRHGGRYAYSSVPETVFTGLTRAASAGRYLDVWIRYRYAFEKLA